jgi:hypothetical protein
MPAIQVRAARTEAASGSTGTRQNAGDNCEDKEHPRDREQHRLCAQVLGWLIRHVALHPTDKDAELVRFMPLTAESDVPRKDGGWS